MNLDLAITRLIGCIYATVNSLNVAWVDVSTPAFKKLLGDQEQHNHSMSSLWAGPQSTYPEVKYLDPRGVSWAESGLQARG